MGSADFNTILEKNTEFLKPFAITLTRDTEVAKDLFQETLYRALANSDKYNVGTNIRAWLYTIMRNIFINNYRRQSKRKVQSGLPVHMSMPDQYVTARQDSEAGVLAKDIMLLVHKLPEIFKTPFILHFEGYRYHEISRMMAEPLGTIKSRIHFARKLLKTQLLKH